MRGTPLVGNHRIFEVKGYPLPKQGIAVKMPGIILLTSSDGYEALTPCHHYRH